MTKINRITHWQPKMQPSVFFTVPLLYKTPLKHVILLANLLLIHLFVPGKDLQLSDKSSKHDLWQRLTWDMTLCLFQLLLNWRHFLGRWEPRCMLSLKAVMVWWVLTDRCLAGGQMPGHKCRHGEQAGRSKGGLAVACFYSATRSHSCQKQTFKSSQRG